MERSGGSTYFDRPGEASSSYLDEPRQPRVLPNPQRWICKRCGHARRRGECLRCGNKTPLTNERRTSGLIR